MDYELRPIVDHELAAFGVAVHRGFGHDFGQSDLPRLERYYPERLRALAVFDQAEMVGTLGDFALTVTVPGGTQIPMAGTTMVGVRPTHRRKGILRSMMKAHLDGAVERGDAVAGLWASEPAIYGRFGFGLGSELMDVTIDARHVALPEGSDVAASFVESEHVEAQVGPFWTEMSSRRAGFIDREPERWASIVADPESRRQGASANRYVVVRRNDDVVGYLSYRQKPKWEDTGVPNGTVVLEDFVSADIEAHRCLWHFATNVDLFPQVHLWNAPVDDTMFLEASDSRSVKRMVSDALFMRILDVSAALSARTYETDGEIVLEIRDDMHYAEGTYRLRVADGQPTIERVTDDADVAMHIRELGALYLGGSRARALAQIGHVTGQPEHIRRLGQLFHTEQAPWCPEMF